MLQDGYITFLNSHKIFELAHKRAKFSFGMPFLFKPHTRVFYMWLMSVCPLFHSIYEKLISYLSIDQLGTNYPKEMYDPHIWEESSYYEALCEYDEDVDCYICIPGSLSQGNK